MLGNKYHRSLGHMLILIFIKYNIERISPSLKNHKNVVNLEKSYIEVACNDFDLNDTELLSIHLKMFLKFMRKIRFRKYWQCFTTNQLFAA